MSVNKDRPHILVLPEDDANRQLANGFLMEVPPISLRKIQVLPVAGGWIRVLDGFLSDHVKDMNHCSARFMVLLIDFDNHQERLEDAKARIPQDLLERVFILGALSEPEALKQAHLGSYETIGKALAEDCRDGTDATWAHKLLRHNAGELYRLREFVRPILFT